MGTRYDRTSISLALLGLSFAGCIGAEADPGVDTVGEPTAQAAAPLIGGIVTNARPEVGTLGFCTATLVDSRYIVTAGYCFNHVTGPRNDVFTMTSTTGALAGQFTVDYGFALDTKGSGADLAFGRLASAVPATTATPASFGRWPAASESVSAFGYGCIDGSSGLKQFVDYPFGNTAISCQGDTGGPRMLGSHGGSGTIWGILSGQWDDSGLDAIANASVYGQMVLDAVRAFGHSSVTNNLVPGIPSWAQASGVRAVAGDFNGDGHGDVALVGGDGWGTLPVAFGNGAGVFSVTNRPLASFPGWARVAHSVVAADFDGDGDTDIALLGGSGWNTIPIALSNRDGTFTVTNLPTANIPGWAQGTGVYAVAGDFDGDGDGDIALLGGRGWGTLPVAFSNRNGTFSVTNLPVVNFPGWAQASGARGLVGDFDGDGDDDIALSGGSGWNTIPVAFSNRTGSFSVTNNSVSDFPGWAQASGAQLVAGDFDGDGDADIAAVGGSGWHTTPFALSNRSGGFTIANLPMSDFPGWGNAARFVLAFKADNNATAALVLTGGSGWVTMPVALLRP